MKALCMNRNFLIIIFGKFVSLLGNAIYEIGLMWYILSKYGDKSGSVLAWVMILGILPSVLLGGFIGSIIDRYNKKWIIVISDLVSGTIVLMVALLMKFNLINNIYLLAATAFLSITASFVSISVSSIIPELFSKEELYAANSMNQFVERGTGLIGFSLGGLLVALLGVEMVFLINAVSFIFSAISEMFIIYKGRERSQVSEKVSFREDMLEVWEFLRFNKNILRLTILFSLVNFLWDPVLSIAAPYVLKNIFEVSSVQFGIIQASLSTGFCLGAIYFSKRKELLEKENIMFYSIFGVNTLFTIFSIPILLSRYFTNNNIAVACFSICLLLAGVFSAAINISMSVKIQLIVPENLRGKYWGFGRGISAGLIPIGCAMAGALIGKVFPGYLFLFSVSSVYFLIILIPRSSYVVRHNLMVSGEKL